MFDKNIQNVLFCNLFFACVRASGFTGETKDLTTPRANTLSDDADDIQRQLDNEARDRMKYGKSKTIWVFHLPARVTAATVQMYRPLRASVGNLKSGKSHSGSHSKDLMKERVTDANTKNLDNVLNEYRWDYKDQTQWGLHYPVCIGRSQSPIDLPYRGFLRVSGARQMLFSNHDVLPKSLTIINQGRNLKLSGNWHASKRPVIYGGAAHSRRYLFDSMVLHWPSEHTIGGFQYPMESQAIYVSAEFVSLDEALHASNDKMALLGVASLYKFANHTHEGLRELLKAAQTASFGSTPVKVHPLSFFNPPFKKYVCYQGSLTVPPCTESVLWLVRAKSLPVTREHVEDVQNILVNGEPQQFVFRQTQPLNDRKIFFFV